MGALATTQPGGSSSVASVLDKFAQWYAELVRVLSSISLGDVATLRDLNVPEPLHNHYPGPRGNSNEKLDDQVKLMQLGASNTGVKGGKCDAARTIQKAFCCKQRRYLSCPKCK